MAAGRRDPGGGDAPGPRGAWRAGPPDTRTDGQTLLCRRPLQSETLPEGPSSHTKENATGNENFPTENTLPSRSQRRPLFCEDSGAAGDHAEVWGRGSRRRAGYDLLHEG